MLNFEMEVSVLFNRKVDEEKDYMSVGSFEMKTKNKSFAFDFKESIRTVDDENPRRCSFVLRKPDCAAFEDLNTISVHDLRGIDQIIECFIFTGEPGESDLEEAEIERITFFVAENGGTQMEVSDDVLREYNQRLHEKQLEYLETLQNQMLEKVKASYDTFISAISKQGIDYVINHCGEICAYQNIIYLLEETNSERFDKQALEKWKQARDEDIYAILCDKVIDIDHSSENEVIVDIINREWEA